MKKSDQFHFLLQNYIPGNIFYVHKSGAQCRVIIKTIAQCIWDWISWYRVLSGNCTGLHTRILCTIQDILISKIAKQDTVYLMQPSMIIHWLGYRMVTPNSFLGWRITNQKKRDIIY